MDINRLLESYQSRVEERSPKLEQFFSGTRPFIVVQRPQTNELWRDCNSVDYVVENNLKAMGRILDFDFTDELPYMEPWVGVGVYANAFGCEYLWRAGEAPATHYKYMTLEEVENIEYPDYRQSPIMRMVIDIIDEMNEKTGGNIPISLTDTQSPFDTATLIVDASNFMIGCYETPEIACRFLNQITDLIIEFSDVQLKHIGNMAAKPGHIMASCANGRGISLSDDNLSFCAAEFNEQFALPFNQRIGEKFGGVAIHSCGNWAHTMPSLRKFDQVFMLDCALSSDCDPQPCLPGQVRDAVKGSGIIMKARVGNNPEKTISMLEQIADPGVQLIVEIGYSEEKAEQNYLAVNNKLEELYGM